MAQGSFGLQKIITNCKGRKIISLSLESWIEFSNIFWACYLMFQLVNISEAICYTVASSEHL